LEACGREYPMVSSGYNCSGLSRAKKNKVKQKYSVNGERQSQLINSLATLR
jgi:hypothetical protein